MGLDMSAVRRLHTKSYGHERKEDRYEVQVTRGGKPVVGIVPSRLSVVEEEVMTWRKANHIHGWFVDNVQEGQDDCRDYYISPDKLTDLYQLCNQVFFASELVDGEVYAGTRYDKKHPHGVVLRTPGKVLRDDTVARKLLPTREGCFFGSTEYDQYYLDEVVRTRDWISHMLAQFKEGLIYDIYYSSSW